MTTLLGVVWVVCLVLNDGAYPLEYRQAHEEIAVPKPEGMLSTTESWHQVTTPDKSGEPRTVAAHCFLKMGRRGSMFIYERSYDPEQNEKNGRSVLFLLSARGFLSAERVDRHRWVVDNYMPHVKDVKDALANVNDVVARITLEEMFGLNKSFGSVSLTPFETFDELRGDAQLKWSRVMVEPNVHAVTIQRRVRYPLKQDTTALMDSRTLIQYVGPEPFRIGLYDRLCSYAPSEREYRQVTRFFYENAMERRPSRIEFESSTKVRDKLVDQRQGWTKSTFEPFSDASFSLEPYGLAGLFEASEIPHGATPWSIYGVAVGFALLVVCILLSRRKATA